MHLFTIRNFENADKDSIITFNTAEIEIASEILGKHSQESRRRKVTAEILEMCDKRRGLGKKRFEPEGS